MSKDIIDLLEKARFELPILLTNIPTRKLIGEVLDKLREAPEQPPANEFTAKVKLNIQNWASVISKITDVRILSIIGWIPQLCDRLDNSEASRKDLLETCMFGDMLEKKYFEPQSEIEFQAMLGVFNLKVKAALAHSDIAAEFANPGRHRVLRFRWIEK